MSADFQAGYWLGVQSAIAGLLIGAYCAWRVHRSDIAAALARGEGEE